MRCNSCARVTDYGPTFRTALWTGCYLQMTLMCVPIHEDIGLENHEDRDQFIRIEQGYALVQMGRNKNQLNFQQNVGVGEGIFIPAVTWHNIKNVGRTPLKVSSIYAPPNHPRGTVHSTKAEAERAEGH